MGRMMGPLLCHSLAMLASGTSPPDNPFYPAAQLRILGALQRPWELRPFYASSIGAGSFLPLASRFTSAAMAGQHPAAPGGTDGAHPTADDGHYSVARTNFLVKVDANVLEREQSF